MTRGAGEPQPGRLRHREPRRRSDVQPFRLTDDSFDADTGRFTDATGRENFYLGDLIGLTLANNTAYAAWTDTRNDNQDIVFTRFPVNPARRPQRSLRAERHARPFRLTDRTGPHRQAGAAEALDPRREQDWFRFQTAATGALTISAFQSQLGDNLRLELYDGTGSALTAGTNLLDESGRVTGEQIVFRARLARPSRCGSAQRPGEMRHSLELQSLTADWGRAFTAWRAVRLASGDEAFYLLKTGGRLLK
jgi:hypothetical protein